MMISEEKSTFSFLFLRSLLRSEDPISDSMDVKKTFDQRRPTPISWQ